MTDDEREQDDAEGIMYERPLSAGESLEVLEWYGRWRPLKGKQDGAEFNFDRRQMEQGRRQFVLDLANCNTMDSTFMGTIASIAIRLNDLGGGDGEHRVADGQDVLVVQRQPGPAHDGRLPRVAATATHSGDL